LTKREAVNERDEVLKRMLKMKPMPHKPKKKKKKDGRARNAKD
jgi:hypothetical protein